MYVKQPWAPPSDPTFILMLLSKPRECSGLLTITPFRPILQVGLAKALHYIILYYIVITIVECNTRKHHEFIAEYCYKCEAQVTISKAMNEWCFPDIVFYYGNNEFIVWQTCRMIGSYVATPPGNKKSILNIDSSGDCPTIEWTNKKRTAEWNSYK